jgi:hypothetical protein
MTALLTTLSKTLAALWLCNRGTRLHWQARFIGADLMEQGAGRLPDGRVVTVTIEINDAPHGPVKWALPVEQIAQVGD